MSGQQIESVHFPAEQHATVATAARHCRRVLARLVDARLLIRLPRQVGGVRAGAEGFTYGLGSIGHRILNQDGSRLRVHEPGDGFVDHQLAVSQLVVDLTRAGRNGQLELLTVQGEPVCWRTVPAVGRSVLRPDLFLTIAAGELEYRWFVEVDRDTHRSPALLRKARLYESYYQSGVEQAAHWVFPRVVWITPGKERAAQLERLLDRGAALPPCPGPTRRRPPPHTSSTAGRRCTGRGRRIHVRAWPDRTPDPEPRWLTATRPPAR